MGPFIMIRIMKELGCFQVKSIGHHARGTWHLPPKNLAITVFGLHARFVSGL